MNFKKELLIAAEDHGIRMEQSQRISLFFNDSLLWRKLILQKSGVPEDDANRIICQIKEETNTRYNKIDFTERTAQLVSDLFRMPFYEMSPESFHALTQLAFSEEPLPLDYLPKGWDRLILITRLIRVANNSPEDIGRQMLDRLGQTLNTKIQSAGTGIEWVRETRLVRGLFSPPLPPLGVIFTGLLTR